MSFGASVPPLSRLEESIKNPSLPIGMRMRAAYYLRHLHEQEEDHQSAQQRQKIISLLGEGLVNEKHGSLMRHEFAYVMGQCRDAEACPVLEETLTNSNDCVMVRHECAEALGSISEARSLSILKQVQDETKDTLPELSQTCQLALDIIDWRLTGQNQEEMPPACACMLNPYNSMDPAPPHPSHANLSADELESILADTDLPLFERYRAMFSLRNKGGEENVQALCHVLIQSNRGDEEALLKHEIAYVLGQMQHSTSVEALETVLRKKNEHDMVRHEAAEALGAIEGRWSDVERILQEFSQDENVVVRESCLVALDAADYWGHAVKARDDTSSSEDKEGSSSFTQQKNAPAPPNRILTNHFNIQE